MFKVIIKDTHEEVSKAAFTVMKEVLDSKPNPVLGLATGSSPVGLYKEMISDYQRSSCFLMISDHFPVGLYKEMIRDHQETGRSYKDIITFNLDEYVGIPRDHEQSYYTFMHENLFNFIDCPEENIHVPEGNREDEQQACIDYENALKQHVVDIQVLGIGSDGHIAFNEPGTPFDSETHLMELTEQTRSDNARFFDGDITQVPTESITQGLGSIMRAKKILLIATGANKADAVYGMLKGEKTTDCPASILQDHADVTVVLDREAASKIA